MHLNEYIERFELSADDCRGYILDYGNITVPSEALVPGFAHSMVRCAPINGTLPFTDFSFDLALCAQYLFNDSDTHDVAFHLQIIEELARVAKEVRIYPVTNSQGTISALLGPVLLGLSNSNYGVEVCDVSTSLQPQNHAMLRVWAQQCHLP